MEVTVPQVGKQEAKIKKEGRKKEMARNDCLLQWHVLQQGPAS